MLKVENLTASIGDVSILNGIDLEVGPGELHAIMGPNGSGKSTLCHVVMGNKDYSQGGKFLLEMKIFLLYHKMRDQIPSVSIFPVPCGFKWSNTDGVFKKHQ